MTLATLKNLRLAIAGTIALNDELLEALDTLYNARVPKKWLKIRWVLVVGKGV
jgi:dynein heavy chain